MFGSCGATGAEIQAHHSKSLSHIDFQFGSQWLEDSIFAICTDMKAMSYFPPKGSVGRTVRDDTPRF